jgi:AmmeMemoRadiSam system protein B
VVFLQYLFEGKRPIRIVPLVVGSFCDSVLTGSPPSEQADVGRMVEALREATAAAGEPVCTIISGDLAHVGPKFGDDGPLTETFLADSRRQDQRILARAEAADADGYFGVIADEQDARRICGLPPTYTVLEALRPGRGKVLHYDQYVQPDGFESVSFASVVFYVLGGSSLRHPPGPPRVGGGSRWRSTHPTPLRLGVVPSCNSPPA